LQAGGHRFDPGRLHQEPGRRAGNGGQKTEDGDGGGWRWFSGFRVKVRIGTGWWFGGSVL
jgi:hypothetical protein